MTEYTQLHENIDSWYDSLNDCYEHAEPCSVHGWSHYPRFNQYIYTYLSCIEEFSYALV